MKNIGIRTKIIIITLIILGGGFFIAPEILEEVAETRYRGTMEDGREKLVKQLEKNYEKINLRNTPRIGDYFVFVYDKESGKLIREYSFFPPRLIDDYNLAKNQFAINEDDLNFIKTESTDKKVSIIVGFSESTSRNIVDGLERFFVLSYLLASIFVVLGILISTEIALKPVSRSIKKISEFEPLYKMEKLDDVKSNDEIGKLISTFNSLLEKVHISSISQKQFISNASHELKTPLTSLKLQIEKLKKQNNTDEKTFIGIEEDVIEIQSIIEALLILETSTKGGSTDGEILLNELIKKTVKGTDVDFKNNLEIMVDSNQEILKLMLNNLIGNAEKFKSNKVIISTDMVDKAPSLIIEDDGIGIHPENYDLIFTPFWQEDESRTRNVGGKGLGLSIVKNIVSKYGWKITAGKSDLGGAKFIVSF
ncbi:HAMP domain-containing sensor histidine kinase [Acidimicrobiia bacterium]|nr:HAMP domain-containing sensor histidine kinase [Acidimicrobiia bacterium]